MLDRNVTHVMQQDLSGDEMSSLLGAEAIIVPINRKHDKNECSNYQGIILLSFPEKVYTRILQQRLKKYVEQVEAEEQAGF